MNGCIEGFRITTALREIHVLTGQNRLSRSKVRIHALPTTWQRTAMENNQQTIVIGIRQNLLIHLHGHLFVTTYKIDLDSTDTDTFHPLHLLTTGNDIVHQASRSLRRIIPVTVGIIPQIQGNTFLFRITGQFFQAFTSDLCIPQGIHKNRLISHCSTEVNILLLRFIIHAAVACYDPAPCTATILIGL